MDPRGRRRTRSGPVLLGGVEQMGIHDPDRTGELPDYQTASLVKSTKTTSSNTKKSRSTGSTGSDVTTWCWDSAWV